MLVGILPGLGPAAAMAIVLPITIYLPPTGSIIIMSGIYYGAMYGGSTTAILIDIPGVVASVVTATDGYAMTKQGRAGEALAIAAIGSFIAPRSSRAFRASASIRTRASRARWRAMSKPR